MQTKTAQQLDQIGQRLAGAQQDGDVEALEALLADDFSLVGPLGFVLDKAGWLDQFRSGALVMRSVRWQDVKVRDYGDVAIAIARQTQEAEYKGQPAAHGQFRVTQVAIRRSGRWLVAGLHFSPIAQGA